MHRAQPHRPAALVLVLLLLLTGTGTAGAGPADPPVPAADIPASGTVTAPQRAMLVATVEPDFSPALPTLHRGLAVADVGGEVRRIGDRAMAGSWSPDGEQIAYAGIGGLRLVERDGSDDRLLVGDVTPAGMAWSPDGSTLLGVVEDGVDRLVVVDVATQAVEVLHSAPLAEAIGIPAWSPDGTRIAFGQTPHDGPQHRMFVIDRDGGPARQLTGDEALATSGLAWTPDGHAVLATTIALGDPAARVTRVAVADGATTTLLNDAQGALVADPGRTRVAEATTGGVVLRPLDGGPSATIAVPGATGRVTPLAWTGDHLVVAAEDGEGLGTVGVLDPATGGFRPVADDVGPVAVAVDPSPPREALPATTARSLWWTRLRPAGSAPVALIGRADDFADSLASGGLQGVLGAPLLLTPTTRLDGAVAEELARLGAERVVLLGGTGALGEEVAGAAAGLGLDVVRVEGPTRLSTAVAAADALVAAAGPPPAVVLARAFGDPEDPTRGFADALAGGAMAADLGVPLLLTATDEVSAEVTGWLDRTPAVTQVLVLGGPTAVGDQVVADLEARGLGVRRLAGPDRGGTAAAVRDAAPDVAASLGRVTGDDGAGGPVQVDGTDPLAWADGFAVAGLTAPSHGGGVLLGAGPATVRSLLAGPQASAARCGPLVAAHPCGEVAAVVAARQDPTSVLAATATTPPTDARTVTFTSWQRGLTVCLRAWLSDGTLDHIVLADQRWAAEDGLVTACVHGLGAPIHETLLDEGAEVMWVFGDGTTVTSPVARQE